MHCYASLGRKRTKRAKLFCILRAIKQSVQSCLRPFVSSSSINQPVSEANPKGHFHGLNRSKGSFPCPPQFFPSYDGKTMNLNPSYTSWVQTDQTLVSLINATLTESVLAQVVGLQTNLS